MNQGKYKGAGIGYARMNAIMAHLRREDLTCEKVAQAIHMEHNQTRKYMKHLCDCGKLTFTQLDHQTPRIYSILPDATDFHVPEPIKPPMASRATGKKIGRPANQPGVIGKYEKGEHRRISVLPARNEGKKRDPLVAALFGEAA